MLRTLTIVLLAVASSSLAGEPLRIIDGDGFELNGENVRLWGIDAPEMDQQCSRDGEAFQCGAFAKDRCRRLQTSGALPALIHRFAPGLSANEARQNRH